jgi:hypothetical protein
MEITIPTAVLKFVTLPFLAGKTQLKVINQVLCCGVRQKKKCIHHGPLDDVVMGGTSSSTLIQHRNLVGYRHGRQ